MLETKNFLILIYGLPASGKTNFSDRIKKLFDDRTTLVICGDLIEHELKINKYFGKDVQEQQNNNMLIQKLNQLSAKIKLTNKIEFEAENWKQSRILIEKLIQRLIGTCSIILEDDLLLRSQRRVYKKISCKYNIQYLQIYMHTTLQQCLTNLSKRRQANIDDVITQQVIKKAANKLQIDNSQYSISITLQDRQKVTKQQIINKLKIVVIKPNDPNDPNIYRQEPKYQHTNQQIIQLQTRKVINSIMKLPQNQIQLKLGKKVMKNKLGQVLSDWKKIYLKSPARSKHTAQIQQHLIKFINQQ